MRVANCQAIVAGVREILWPEDPPADGKTVRRRLFSFLARERRQAPQRGRGAYLRRFIEHVQKVTRSYAAGLFHCYDDPRIPQTNNELEGINGAAKRNLRRCAGHGSTAHGPGASRGPIYLFGVILHRNLSASEIDEFLSDYDANEYREAKKRIHEIAEPQRRRRSFLRSPLKCLQEIIANWKDT